MAVTYTPNHAKAVQESVAITRMQWRMMKKMSSAEVDPFEILRALTKKRIPFVLTGAQGIAGWMGNPRATKDTDILVKGGRNQARAVKAIRELYPHLEVRSFAGVTSFFIPGEIQSIIDVTYPHRADAEETLASKVWVEDRGIRYRIPSLEAALANKYGAMLNLVRDAGKRLQDAADFTKMVQRSLREGQKAIDLDKLRALGESVWPSGGGEEIIRLIDQVKQGAVINLNALYGVR